MGVYDAACRTSYTSPPKNVNLRNGSARRRQRENRDAKYKAGKTERLRKRQQAAREAEAREAALEVTTQGASLSEVGESILFFSI